MLNVSKKVVITLLLASFAPVASSQQDSLPEKYTKKVLIEAKWGDGPGEFKLVNTPEGPLGIGDLVLDLHGNIYIPNINKGTLVKFDPNGKYLCEIPVPDFLDDYSVDEKGNIYIPVVVTSAMIRDSIGMRLIKHYNSAGELLRAHRIMVDVSSAQNGYTTSANMGSTPEILNGEIVLPKEGKVLIIGSVDKEYEKAQQRVINRTVKYKYQIVRNLGKEILEIQTIGKQTKHIRLMSEDEKGNNIYIGNNIGIDRDGNGYFFAEVGKIGRKNVQDFEIWKFNTDGELLARFQIGHKGEDYAGLWGRNRRAVDIMGNIYYLLTSKEYVRVYKFEKESKGGNK